MRFPLDPKVQPPVKAENALQNYFKRLQQHHKTVEYRLDMEKAASALNRLSARFPPQTMDMFLQTANTALQNNSLDPSTQTGRILQRYMLPLDPLAIEAHRKQAKAYKKIIQDV